MRLLLLGGQIYWLAGNVLVGRGNATEAQQAMLQSTDTLQTGFDEASSG
ncbi:MAG: hypothetical protein Q7T69_20880 [Rhodoferax sp.]|nr:hypothetical protein [Rhodoferax sp.]